MDVLVEPTHRRPMYEAPPPPQIRVDHSPYVVKVYLGKGLLGYAVRTALGWHVPTRARSPEGVRLRYRSGQLVVEAYPKRVAWRSFATRAEAVAALGGAA